MKTFVISLDSREDRRKLFDDANKGIIEYEYSNHSHNGDEIAYSQLRRMGFDCVHAAFGMV